MQKVSKKPETTNSSWKNFLDNHTRIFFYDKEVFEIGTLCKSKRQHLQVIQEAIEGENQSKNVPSLTLIANILKKTQSFYWIDWNGMSKINAT